MIKAAADASASYVLVIACLMMLSSLVLQGATRSPPHDDVPPAGSASVVRAVDVVFPSTTRAPAVATETYLYYIHTKPSRPAEGDWILFDAHAIADDVRRLWATGFLENIAVDVTDEPYDTGVIGKHIVFRLEERVRIASVEFNGSTTLDAAEIDRRLVESNARIPLDSMLDAAKIKR